MISYRILFIQKTHLMELNQQFLMMSQREGPIAAYLSKIYLEDITASTFKHRSLFGWNLFKLKSFPAHNFECKRQLHP